ncbi:MAG: GNAT family N-acetyltransferase [Eubacteriales bacterium]|nr:GNAT family N-acetyltransferase [Eubacteriales bacterium]
MHAEIRIRQATPADSADLLTLIQWAMQVYAAKSGITAPLDAMRETQVDLQRFIRDHYVLVAEHRGTLIGTVRLVRLDADRAYFSRFAVHPHLQQTGVGKLIYQVAENWLIQQGFKRVSLHTAMTNEPLVSFYEARGFKLVETETSRGYARGLFEKTIST